MDAVLLAVAADCEASAGRVAQPVNAWSSLAFVAAGAWVLGRAGSSDTAALARAAGLGLGVVGAGSFAFHAGSGAGGQWLHDAALVAVVVLAAAVHTVGRRRLRRPALVAAGGAVAVAVAVAAAPGVTNIAVGALVGGVAVLELARRSAPGARRILHRPLLALLGAAIVAFAAGRGTSPLCDPRSVIQFHALWHILVAIAGAWWAARAFDLELGGARLPRLRSFRRRGAQPGRAGHRHG